MTVQNPPVFLQAGSHPAEDVRRMFAALTFDSARIAKPTALLVSASSGMTVSIASGRIFVPGTEATYQGTYFCENRGATTVTHDPSDAALDRIDLVVARVRDAAYSGSTNSWAIEIVKGANAAAGSAVAPSLPANSVGLAQVAITHGLSTITSAQITDLRPRPLVDPSLSDAGQVTITPVANTPTFVHVNFAFAFPNPPIVVATPLTTVPGQSVLGVGVQNVTTTGCDVYVDRVNTNSTIVNWIARGT